MKDIFDRKINPGDYVVYASSGDGPLMNIGLVKSYCENGADKVRVQVLKSNSYRFVWWKPNKTYVVTIGSPNHVLVINGASILDTLKMEVQSEKKEE
jgi:hypothetical protein